MTPPSCSFGRYNRSKPLQPSINTAASESFKLSTSVVLSSTLLPHQNSTSLILVLLQHLCRLSAVISPAHKLNDLSSASNKCSSSSTNSGPPASQEKEPERRRMAGSYSWGTLYRGRQHNLQFIPYILRRFQSFEYLYVKMIKISVDSRDTEVRGDPKKDPVTDCWSFH